MSHEVVWTERVEKFFAEKGNLTEHERKILHLRVMGLTRTQIKFYLDDGTEVWTIDRIVKKLKKRYDVVQKEYPDILPVRKECEQEAYMDTH